MTPETKDAFQGKAISRLRVLPFFLRDNRASETRARVKIIPREKRRHACEEKWGLLVV